MPRSSTPRGVTDSGNRTTEGGTVPLGGWPAHGRFQQSARMGEHNNPMAMGALRRSRETGRADAPRPTGQTHTTPKVHPRGGGWEGRGSALWSWGDVLDTQGNPEGSPCMPRGRSSELRSGLG